MNLATWLDKEYDSTEHRYLTFLCNWYSGERNMSKQPPLKYWIFSPLSLLFLTEKCKAVAWENRMIKF